MTLYELLVLRPAFDESDRGRLIQRITLTDPPRPRTIDRRVPLDLETIVVKATCREPRGRYQTAAEMADDLSRYLSDRSILARRSAYWETAWRWCRRNPLNAALTTLVALLLVAITAVSTGAAWRLHNEQAATQHQLFLTEAAQRLAEARAEENRLALERLNASDRLIQTGRDYIEYKRRWEQAHRAFSEAIVLRPDSSGGWYDRGLFYTRLGLWDLAAADFEEGFRRQAPGPQRHWFGQALLRLYVRDMEGYDRVRQRLREHFQEAGANSEDDNEVIRACTLAPENDDDCQWLKSMAQQAIKRDPRGAWNHVALGLAQYQDGDIDGAMSAFQESLIVDPKWIKGTIAKTGIALCHHREGNTNNARQSLAEAAQGLDEWMATAWSQRVGLLPTLWHDWVECMIRWRDAYMTIEGTPPPEDVRFYLVRARALAAVGLPELTVDACRRAAVLRPDDKDTRLACWKILADRQWFVQAKELMRDPPSDADTQFAWAEECHRRQRYTDAEVGFARYISLRPDDERGYERRGTVRLRMGKADEAIADYTRRIELADICDHWIARGWAYGELNRWKEAREDFSQAISRDAGSALAWHYRGLAHRRLGLGDAALADFERALELSPDDIDTFWERAEYYREVKSWQAAVADFSRVIELDPRRLNAWRMRGFCYQQSREWHMAISDFSEVLRLNAADAEVLNWRGYCQRKLGNLNEALPDHERAIELNPNIAEFWYRCAYVHLRFERWDRALADYQRAVDLDPQSAGAQNGVAWILATRPQSSLRDPRRALVYAQRAVELEPEIADWWNTLGAAHLCSGNCGAAREALTRARSLRGAVQADDMLFLSMAHAGLGEWDEARREFASAVRWIEEHAPGDTELLRLRDEAERVLAPSQK